MRMGQRGLMSAPSLRRRCARTTRTIHCWRVTRYTGDSMIQRGDVAIVDVPFTDVARSKARPAIIVQNDRDNARLRKTIVILITGNLKRLGDPSHFLIDPGTPDGASAGIHGPSVASCNN